MLDCSLMHKLKFQYRMTNNSNQNFFKGFQRSLTQNVMQTKTRFRQKTQGNSEFVKSKFDIDYDPKYRVIKHMQIYKSKNLSKQSAKSQQLAFLVSKTQEQIKKGKKIVIDWSQQNNFRSTKFPSLGQKYMFARKVNTQQLYYPNLETPKKTKYYDYLQKFKNNPALKSIATKGQYLREIITQNIAGRRKKASKARRFPSSFSVQQQKNKNCQKLQSSPAKLQNPYFNYAIIEQVEQLKKQFFQQNNQKIQQAINYEKNLEQSSIHEQKKQKIQIIQDRILCKSKLTLLKCDLAKKFKQIQNSVLNDENLFKKRSSIT